MTRRQRYVAWARRIYCGTVFAAALVAFGVGQWHDGVAAIAVPIAFGLTMPLSLEGYFLIAYSWWGLADLVWERETVLTNIIGVPFISAGFALMALVQFEVVRCAAVGVVRIARLLGTYPTPGPFGRRRHP